MDRVGVFVDAGWLLAAGSLDLLGTSRRDELDCDYRALVDGIVSQVDAHSGGAPRLRTYWYDGAPGGSPSYEHDRIAALPYVKVRLGRLSRSRQQKGVDVLIYHDLLTLASARAITRAYLIAGDEDLREGVSEAQKLGIQVVLFGMPVEKGHNQSARLVRECDEYLTLPRGSWHPALRRREPGSREAAHEDVVAMRRVAGDFAREWARGRTTEEVRELLSRFPTLPSDLDAALLARGEETAGSLRRRHDLKEELRATFWFEFKDAASRGDDQREPGEGAD